MQLKYLHKGMNNECRRASEPALKTKMQEQAVISGRFREILH